ncbi:MAG: OmpA family protein [Acidobacteriota bacterium]
MMEEPTMKSYTTGVVLALGLAAAACHTRPPAVAPARTAAPAAPPTVPARPPLPPPPPAAPGQADTSLSQEELFRRMSLEALNAEHPLSDAFFDYDQRTLREDARTALQRDAAWLAKWPQTTVSVEGHCDERGTAEYNLALGEERAAAVKAYLEDLGVSSNRVRTVSVGKEAGFCHELNEGCWSQNRRGHFLITGK